MQYFLGWTLFWSIYRSPKWTWHPSNLHLTPRYVERFSRGPAKSTRHITSFWRWNNVVLTFWTLYRRWNDVVRVLGISVMKNLLLCTQIGYDMSLSSLDDFDDLRAIGWPEETHPSFIKLSQKKTRPAPEVRANLEGVVEGGEGFRKKANCNA